MALKDIKGIGIAYRKKLIEAKVETIEDLALADLSEIAQRTGISLSKLKEWKKEARRLVQYKKAEIAEDIAKKAVYVPIYTQLKRKDIAYIANKLNN